jgi:AraC-like DNA-binding protein
MFCESGSKIAKMDRNLQNENQERFPGMEKSPFLKLQTVGVDGPQKLLLEAGGFWLVGGASPPAVLEFGSIRRMLNPGSIHLLFGGAEAVCSTSSACQVPGWVLGARLDHFWFLLTGSENRSLREFASGPPELIEFVAESKTAVDCQNRVSELPPEDCLEHRVEVLRIAAVGVSSALRRTSFSKVDSCGSDHRFGDVLGRLSSEELTNLSVDELSRKFGCGRRHLNRLFQRHLGISATELKIETRLMKAACLLRDPNLKIIVVAQEAGFNHLGAFNTSFRKRFNLSPSEFRKRVLSEDAQETCAGNGLLGCAMDRFGLCPGAVATPGRSNFLPVSILNHPVASGPGPDKKDSVRRPLPRTGPNLRMPE